MVGVIKISLARFWAKNLGYEQFRFGKIGQFSAQPENPARTPEMSGFDADFFWSEPQLDPQLLFEMGHFFFYQSPTHDHL